ncbi:MAG: hypothetical protein QOJ03_2312 [Frankiaceae bacterium]|nr:hypothetical protein [Frankiaceae bacterium]
MARNLAYLDGGTASMMLQVVVGAVAAALVTLKLFWRRVLVALRLRRPAPPARPGSGQTTEGEQPRVDHPSA